MANPEHLRLLKSGIDEWNRKRPPSVAPEEEHAGFGPGEEHTYTVDLTGADLQGVDLEDAFLFNADFSGANLLGANLKGVNLGAGCLYSANLRGADLRVESLAGCELSKADLRYAVISAGDAVRATFDGAILGNTLFADIDLSEVCGLDEVVHESPSWLAMKTIAASEGDVPKGFLIGCGLDAWQIEFCKLHSPKLSPDQVNDIVYRMSELRTATGIQYYSCFISYSHADKQFAKWLYKALQDRGIRCWLDEKQLLPGDDIYEMVDRGIRLWDKVLLCCSKHSLTSWWVDNEIGKVFAKEQAIMTKRRKKVLAVIPLNLDGYLFDWQDGKGDELRRRFAADFTGWNAENRSFDEPIKQVIRALRADQGGREEAPRWRF